MDEIRFIDKFSGIGGFRWGLELSGGYRCVWSNDINKYANQVYLKHWPDSNHNSGDIRRVDTAEIPDHDLLCAGFPCQTFSVAGKRLGFKETRGTLFFEICRIAEAKRPRLLLLENVKGLLSHEEGRTFATILKSLEELGYWWEYQVLNSKHFGVPQNRERVFIIGHLGESGRGAIFPIKEVHRNGITRTKPESWGQTGATLSGRSAGGGNARGNYVLTPQEISNAIDANYWKGPDKHDQRTIIVDYLNRSIKKDEVFNTIKTNQGSPSSASAIIQPLKFLNRNQKNFGDEAMTVDTANSTGIRLGARIRRLTPIECERLQGFPDGWTEGISDTQRYKCLGNAVTVNVIKFLGDKIKECLN